MSIDQKPSHRATGLPFPARRWRLAVTMVILVCVGGSALLLTSTWQNRVREDQLRAMGGRILYKSSWPAWMPRWADFPRGKNLFRRVSGVDFMGRPIGRDRLRNVLRTLEGAGQLDILRIGGNGLGDRDIRILGRFAQLQELDLSNSPVTDAGLDQLLQCPRLQSLNLAGTEVTDAGLPILCALTDLRSLHLDHTRVSDAGIQQLSCLPALEELSLSATEVSETGVHALSGELSDLSISDD